MDHYPVNLAMRGKTALVVGGGGVGARKVARLLACGARVTVVSPDAQDQIRLLAARGRINWRQRGYSSQYLDGVFLVIAATSSPQLNRRIGRDAAKRNLLCNVVDQPGLGNFILPAVVDCGHLTLTVSTDGQSPAFAKYLKNELQLRFGPEYDRFLMLMGAVRGKLLRSSLPAAAHKPLFEKLIRRGLLDRVRAGHPDDIDRLLCAVLGPGYACAELLPDVYGPDQPVKQES